MLSLVIIDSECNTHMSSDWRLFCIFHIKSGIQAKCANSELVDASGVDDVDILKN